MNKEIYIKVVSDKIIEIEKSLFDKLKKDYKKYSKYVYYRKDKNLQSFLLEIPQNKTILSIFKSFVKNNNYDFSPTRLTNVLKNKILSETTYKDFTKCSKKVGELLKQKEYIAIQDKYGFFEQAKEGIGGVSIYPKGNNKYEFRNNTEKRCIYLPGASTNMSEEEIIKALKTFELCKIKGTDQLKKEEIDKYIDNFIDKKENSMGIELTSKQKAELIKKCRDEFKKFLDENEDELIDRMDGILGDFEKKLKVKNCDHPAYDYVGEVERDFSEIAEYAFPSFRKGDAKSKKPKNKAKSDKIDYSDYDSAPDFCQFGVKCKNLKSAVDPNGNGNIYWCDKYDKKGNDFQKACKSCKELSKWNEINGEPVDNEKSVYDELEELADMGSGDEDCFFDGRGYTYDTYSEHNYYKMIDICEENGINYQSFDDNENDGERSYSVVIDRDESEYEY